ncbi:MAG TPA: EAL domain-containing protein [Burkholderiaceae bacterium]|nr:EAL domain-containing protein [Burkholderiaceae bacterium]
MDQTIRILMLEDVATEAELALRELQRDGLRCELQRVETQAAFSTALSQHRPDIILSDYSLPGFDGLSALRIAQAQCPEVPFVFVSGTIGEEVAIEALRNGAVDYVLKNNLQRLASAVRRAIKERHERTARLHAESRFRDLIEFAPDAIVVINQHGKIETVNRQMELLFGCPRTRLVGTCSRSLIPARLAEWDQALSGEQAMLRALDTLGKPFEVPMCRADGSEFPAEISLSPLKTGDGLWISGVIRDLSERKEQEERLARMTRIRTILGSINGALLRIRDRKSLLREACRIAVEEGRFIGAAIGLVDPDTLIVTPQVWAGIDAEFLREVPVSADPSRPDGTGMVGTAMRTGESQVAHDLLQSSDLALWPAAMLKRGIRSTFVVPLMVGEQAIGVIALFSVKPDAFNPEEQQLLSALAADISFALDYIAKSEQLNYLAYFDAITGLPNRALFQDRMEQLVTQGVNGTPEKIAVVLIDIERFRDVNDTLGRAAGDDILRTVARRLRDIVSDSNYLARISADCFAFIVRENASVTEVANLLERKLSIQLSQPIPTHGRELRVFVKAGIALFPSDGTAADILLRNAEAALKNAKETKAHYLFYTAEMNVRTARKFSMENRLRRAFDRQQFVLHYQPKVNLASGEIVGLEALLRWQEPGVGLVLPGAFISILEETGLIVDVGSWVIQRACEQYQKWRAQGIDPPRIAVNVSQRQLRQENFVEHILQLATADGIRGLEIEITESLFMDDTNRDTACAKLAALRQAGMTVAIDDFGTGYSSLSYIAHLPIDTLKIDRSFVSDMAVSRSHKAIVSTIISLAHSLNLTVVAEGVETPEQEQLLAAFGCDQVQGFLYTPALPPDQIAPRLRRFFPTAAD